MINKSFSKRNQRGVIVLLIILSGIILAPRAYSWIFPKEAITVRVAQLNQGVEEIQQNQKYADQRKFQKKSRYHRPASKFNPNSYQMGDWMALGLSEKQANIVLKFTSRGIYSNEQLKKIFVIDEQLFNLIKDSTFYPEKPTISYTKTETKEKTQAKVDINSANYDELLKLPGIGDYYAKKIIERRDLLGGYISEEQLLELYKFDEEKLNKLKSAIWVDPSRVQLININTASAETLAKHPYIKWNVANSIVKMRMHRKEYTDINQLLESELISKELLLKLKPYLALK